jgi:hypothetical protein
VGVASSNLAVPTNFDKFEFQVLPKQNNFPVASFAKQNKFRRIGETANNFPVASFAKANKARAPRGRHHLNTQMARTEASPRRSVKLFSIATL